MSQIIKDMTEITRCGVDYRTEMLAPLGLKACHASYLLEICGEPGISQDQLAQRLYINKSNVARQVAILEENGLSHRKNHGDPASDSGDHEPLGSLSDP